MRSIYEKHLSVKPSQIGLIMLTVITGSKFLSVPASVAAFAGRDGWLSMIILFALDLLVLVCLLWSVRLNTNDKNLNDILENCLSPVGARIIYALLFLFSTIRQLDLMSATQKVFSATLTLRTNWPGFALPLIALSVFVVILGFRSLARVAEFIAGWVFFAAVAMLLFSLSKTDFTELLPILANGFTPVGTGALNHTFFFTDSLFIIFLLSRIKKERKMFRSPITAFLIGAVITILLYVVFYALFGDIAWLQDSAMPKVSQFNTTLTSNGRLDWLTVVIWLAAIFIKIILFFFCSVYSIAGFFRCKENQLHPLFLVFYSLLLLMLPLLLPVEAFTNDFFVLGAGKFILWIVQYLLPFSLPVFTFLSNKKTSSVKEEMYVSI